MSVDVDFLTEVEGEYVQKKKHYWTEGLLDDMRNPHSSAVWSVNNSLELRPGIILVSILWVIVSVIAEFNNLHQEGRL